MKLADDLHDLMMIVRLHGGFRRRQLFNKHRFCHDPCLFIFIIESVFVSSNKYGGIVAYRYMSIATVSARVEYGHDTSASTVPSTTSVPLTAGADTTTGPFTPISSSCRIAARFYGVGVLQEARRVAIPISRRTDRKFSRLSSTDISPYGTAAVASRHLPTERLGRVTTFISIATLRLRCAVFTIRGGSRWR